MLAALELGLVGGLVAAAGATALRASGEVLPAVAPLAVAVAGGLQRPHAGVHARGQRLLDSALALGEPGEDDRLPRIVATRRSACRA